jgi:orotate phosphoribosyltransferase-like protein
LLIKSELIELIKSLRSQGLSMGKIADHLNKENIKTARGRAWYSSTIKNILDREEK